MFNDEETELITVPTVKEKITRLEYLKERFENGETYAVWDVDKTIVGSEILYIHEIGNVSIVEITFHDRKGIYCMLFMDGKDIRVVAKSLDTGIGFATILKKFPWLLKLHNSILRRFGIESLKGK